MAQRGGTTGRAEALPGPVAAEVLTLLGSGRQIAPFTGRHPDFGLVQAYRAATALRQARVARGETPVGRKIGFTNRTIWAEFGVDAPIWGDVYASTVLDLAACAAGPSGGFSLAGLAEPRIEPEIAFGLSAVPEPGMDDAALLACIDWLAHGFEIVQSIYPGWRFAAADTVAAGGLHGALLLGPRHRVAVRHGDWLRDLPGFDIELLRDGETMDRGSARNVLDGPLSALRHLAGLLAADLEQPPLRPGEIVTTGTLTRALPIAAGEQWQTRLAGIALDGIGIRFV